MAKNKKRNRTRKEINPTPVFAVGDRIKHPKYGVGVITGLSTDKYPMFPDFDFFYNADFTGKGGDGTKVWLPKVKTEKTCEVVSV